MQIVIDIDEEDFNIMKHNVAIDNPLCPLGEKEMVTAVANGTPIPDNATNGDMIEKMFPNCEQKEHMNNRYFEMYFDNDLKNASYMRVSKEWWNAPYWEE